MKKIIMTIFLLSVMTFTSTLLPQEECPFPTIYSNPIGTIGSFVKCHGRIQKIMSAGLPLCLIMKTDNYLWYSEIFQTPIAPGTIFEGNTIFIKGQYIGQKQVLYEGSLISLPLVYVTEVGK